MCGSGLDQLCQSVSEQSRRRTSLQLTSTSPVSLFFFQAEDGIRDLTVTGVQTCALPISMIANGIDKTRATRTMSTGGASEILSSPMTRLRCVLLTTVVRTSMTCSGKNEIGRASCRERV